MNTRQMIEEAGTPSAPGLVYKRSENYQIAHVLGYVDTDIDIEDERTDNEA